jgi:hypothetical protein
MAGRHSELIHWTVSIVHSKYDESQYSVDFGNEYVGPVTAITRSRLKDDDLSIGVLMNPATSAGFRLGDESIGLSTEQIAAAEDRYNKDHSLDPADRANVTPGYALREQRDKREGLLLIYPISPYSRATTKDRKNLFDEPSGQPPVIGVGISLPVTQNNTSVPYVRGRAPRNSQLGTSNE